MLNLTIKIKKQINEQNSKNEKKISSPSYSKNEFSSDTQNYRTKFIGQI